jgi:hypothetical protein
MLGNFTYRLSFATEDQAAIRASLLQLLHMMFENIAALSVDDRWLRGQAESLMAASTPPLTLRRLDDVQLRLKDVIFKQTEAKARAVEAQEQMKDMLATFIERLAKMTDSSTTYHEHDGTLRRPDRQGLQPGGNCPRAGRGDASHPRHGAGHRTHPRPSCTNCASAPTLKHAQWHGCSRNSTAPAPRHGTTR